VHLPIEPELVAQVSAPFPDDPATVENWVRETIVYDANDYAGWGAILYIASPEEVLRRGRAPCYGRAVVLASILEAKGIPYRVFGIALHMWVDYTGRTPSSVLEFPRYAVLR
jgi:transglutaminase-like putative cysteine protease